MGLGGADGENNNVLIIKEYLYITAVIVYYLALYPWGGRPESPEEDRIRIHIESLVIDPRFDQTHGLNITFVEVRIRETNSGLSQKLPVTVNSHMRWAWVAVHHICWACSHGVSRWDELIKYDPKMKKLIKEVHFLVQLGVEEGGSQTFGRRVNIGS
jgi:hypothetical protein